MTQKRDILINQLIATGDPTAIKAVIADCRSRAKGPSRHLWLRKARTWEHLRTRALIQHDRRNGTPPPQPDRRFIWRADWHEVVADWTNGK